MKYPKFKILVVTVALGAGLGGAAQAAAPEPVDTAATAPAAPPWHGHRGAGLRRLLAQLDLSAAQKSQIKTILQQAMPQMQSLRTDGRTTWQSLATTPPTDSGYAGLVSAAQQNAAARVQLRSDIWSQVYAVLTPAQQAKIPGIIAARQAAWAARRAAWQQRNSAIE